ncbi:type 4b pilus protein PilO2 [Paraburkholderia largidicola]|uniref:Uncharacterized protein n=1 Tax=Paraburkholderia largidicola TaxID=3014751 RepID=A0A7I8C5F3_9BURK|nr:type 4b pilus protein PilO2 [Paraburkholderia sp. PGU16]BCF95428.1 hypothetical protein PPGU16_84950 [Paraburkholderia sp. PGU16]
MEWSSYTTVPKRAELLHDAGDDGTGEPAAPWYSLRVTDEVMQAGFCAPVGDVVRPRKLASLAAMLADAKPQPWLGKFQIAENLYWYIAVRDEYAILPGGDVVGTDDEIEAALAEHIGYGGWNRVEGDLETLSKLLAGNKAKRTPVRSLAVSRIDPLPAAIIAVAVAILGGGGLGGVHAYHSWKHHKELEARRRNPTSKPVEYIPGAGDYLAKTPAPSDWLQACHEAFATVQPSVNGWLSSAGACDSAGATVRWVRGEGATLDYPPPGVIDDSGEQSTQTIRVVPPSKMGTDNAADVRTERLALIAWGQRYGSMVTVGTAQPLSAKAAVGYSIPVTIPMPISPFEPGHGLDQIPGLRITGIGPNTTQATAHGSSNEPASASAWALTGVLYARQ